jgi:hypothetical protein
VLVPQSKVPPPNTISLDEIYGGSKPKKQYGIDQQLGITYEELFENKGPTATTPTAPQTLSKQKVLFEDDDSEFIITPK